VVHSGVISVNVAMHLSLHFDSDAPPDPAALPDGVKDGNERLRKPPRPHPGAKVEIQGTAISALTDSKGTCQLPVTGLADGNYVVVITPPTSEDAGPLVPKGARLVRQQPSPARLVAPAGIDFAYRGTRVAITIESQKLKTHPRVADPTHIHARVLKGATPASFEVDLKPDWLRDKDATARSATLDLVVVHHTAGKTLAGDLGTFTSSDKSIHYLMDRDGHIVKMVNDDEVAVQAGRTWSRPTLVRYRRIFAPSAP